MQGELLGRVVVTSLLEPFFSQIGKEKKFELRRLNKKYDLLAGDFILAFKRGGKGEFVLLKVLASRKGRLGELVTEENFKHVIPDANSVDEAHQRIREIYPKEKEFVLLKIEVVGMGRTSPSEIIAYF